MSRQDIIYSEFDIETHKKNFIDYLEVVITDDGIIHYAIPSHNEFVYKLLIDKFKLKDKDDLYEFLKNLPIYIDPTQLAKCCCVWVNNVNGYVNNKILKSLKLLQDNELLKLENKKW